MQGGLPGARPPMPHAPTSQAGMMPTSQPGMMPGMPQMAQPGTLGLTNIDRKLRKNTIWTMYGGLEICVLSTPFVVVYSYSLMLSADWSMKH